MVLTALRALCVLLSALCAATHVLETVGVFRRWSHLDGFLVPSSFFRAEGKSRIQCSSVCLGDSECRSFTYEEDRRACYLHRSHWPLPGDSRPGAATFHRKWTHCPQDWDILEENVCVKLISEWMSWQSAVQNCLQLGGNLIAVETQAKESLLRSYLQARNVNFVWLGASDLEVEGQWKWKATGDTAHIHWRGSEPNGGTVENCLGMLGTHLKVIDARCSGSWRSVCEIPL